MRHIAQYAVVGSTLVLSKDNLARKLEISGLCWVGIVLINFLLGNVVFVLKFDEREAGVVGGNGSCDGFIEQLIALGGSLKSIVAWFEVEESKESVPLVVDGVGSNLGAVLLENYLCAIDGQPLVVGAVGILVEVVNDFLVQVLHGTGNLALACEVEAPVGGNTARLADTLKTVVVEVQSAVTCWLIGVEEALVQIAWNAMLEHAQVAAVLLAIVACGSAVAAIEADVATHVHACCAVVALWINLAHVVEWPHGACHVVAAGNTWSVVTCRTSGASVVAAIENQRIIGAGAVGSGIGVRRDEHVEVALFYLLADVGKVFVVDVIGVIVAIWCGVRPWAVCLTAHYDVLAFYPHRFKIILNSKSSWQRATSFIEAQGVGVHPCSALGIELASVGMSYRWHWTVVGTIAAMTGIQINAELIGSLCLKRETSYYGCCQ